MVKVNKLLLHSYLFDLTFLVLCILWHTGKVAVCGGYRCIPVVVKSVFLSSVSKKAALAIKKFLLLFRYLLKNIYYQNLERFLVKLTNNNLLWTRIIRSSSESKDVLQRVKSVILEKKFYENIHHTTRMNIYKRMPLRSLSRIWGYLNSLELPVWAREPTYHLYTWVFGCNLEEAITQDLKKYKNLSEFFRRLLKPELRPISAKSSLTSPVDGTVLYCGMVKKNMLEQVKGVTYSLQEFLGPFESSRFVNMRNTFKEEDSDDSGVQSEDNEEVKDEVVETDEDDYDEDRRGINLKFPERNDEEEETKEIKTKELSIQEIKKKAVDQRMNQNRLPSKCYSMVDLKADIASSQSTSYTSLHQLNKESSQLLENPTENSLFYCVVYLAPGDYHRFHSPANWNVHYRRHFPGELFSVKPSVARWLKGLFNMNERVVYFGKWVHGFFSMTAVGATNVGSISVYVDKKLKTNANEKINQGRFFDKSFVKKNESYLKDDITTEGIFMKKGKLFGEFNLGSTIVLLFEGPKDLKFKVEPGQKVKYGQQMGSI